jgi:uncharacterized membrane protein (UPF0127 family)
MRLRPALGLLPLVLVFAFTSACEPRIEEPTPPRKEPLAQVAPPKASASAERCILPTPKEPSRPAFAGPVPDPRCPADPGPIPKLRSGKVVFPEAARTTLSVEIAAQDAERMRGLMFRKQLDETRGMIFRFEEREDHTFWMKNTCIPLDMLFIDGDGVIVGIEENVPTLNESSYHVGCPSNYVLEVNAGWARRHGVVAGQRVILEGI